MFPDPYILIAKLVGVLLISTTLFFSGFKFANDRNAVKMQATIIAQYQANEAEVAKQRSINLQVSAEHEDKIKSLAANLAAARRGISASGGLRVPRSTCEGFAPSARLGNAPASPETVALPDSTTERLLVAAADADTVVEQLRSCQDWIKKNGMYGKVDTR